MMWKAVSVVLLIFVIMHADATTVNAQSKTDSSIPIPGFSFINWLWGGGVDTTIICQLEKRIEMVQRTHAAILSPCTFTIAGKVKRIIRMKE
jgi:quinol-cytochrome oxidoreductase complex cytochrome b subunit